MEESTSADDLIDRINAAVAREQAEAARAFVEMARKRLSVPAGRAGGRRVHSKRGEPARMISGALRGSVQTGTIDVGGIVETVVFTDADHAEHLEKNGRLVLSDLFDLFAQQQIDAAVRGIEGD